MENENNTYTKLENFRYERKFKPSALSVFQVRNVVKESSAFFRNIYHPRSVNNIYFDTPEFDAYYDNIGGKSDRRKYRIRWYGDYNGKICGAVFEIKIKSAYRGTKLSFFLPDFNIEDSMSSGFLKSIIKSSDMGPEIYEQVAGLEIKLMNRYKREYYRDLSGNFRLTIDYEIEYTKLNESFNRLNDKFTDPEVVVEIKYDEEYNESASGIINTLPFRMTRNSKFVDGMAGFYALGY
jgi:SPX domain protein involved in polyphosphate accumulation